MNRLLLLLSVILAAISQTTASAQEYKIGAIKIEVPWTRATPTGAKVAGGFMKITNTGTDPDRLIGGTATVAGKFEVHEMAMIDSVMKMRELDGGLEIKPGQSVELRPGSYHVMFMDMSQTLKEGDKVKGTLVFAKAGKIDVEYTVRALGAQSDPQKMKH